MRARSTMATAAMLTATLIAGGCGPRSEPRTNGAASKLTPAQLQAAVGNTATTLATKAGCVFSTPRQVEASHVDAPDPGTWSSDPPTSGAHNQNWMPWGDYERQVKDKYALHNLEHGGVILWYGSGSGEAVAAAVVPTLKDGQKWIVSPRSDLDGKGVVFAAWGRMLTCDEAASGKVGSTSAPSIAAGWLRGAGSKGTESEKDIPAYPGSVTDPAPLHDLSIER